MSSDHADTTPPPGPLPSMLPHEQHLDYVESARIGELLHASDVIGAYIRSKIDGDLADAANDFWKREIEDRKAFRQEMREGMAELRKAIRGIAVSNERIEYNQKVLYAHFHEVTGRVTAIEGQHASNHPVKLSVPPSSRRGTELEPEVESAPDVEALEG
jgi:hypothetical protein